MTLGGLGDIRGTWSLKGTLRCGFKQLWVAICGPTNGNSVYNGPCVILKRLGHGAGM